MRLPALALLIVLARVLDVDPGELVWRVLDMLEPGKDLMPPLPRLAEAVMMAFCSPRTASEVVSTNPAQKERTPWDGVLICTRRGHNP